MKISVVMNCYNGAQFVRGAIQSVYDQSYPDWEIVFWDNASTDGTAEIAHEFDDRLRYFRSRENTPLGKARQMAIAEAKGEWITLLDCDDRLFPRCFEQQMQTLSATPNAVLSYGAIALVDAVGRQFAVQKTKNTTDYLLGRLLWRYDINPVGTLVKRSVVAPMPPIETLQFAEEYAIYLHAAAQGVTCVLPIVLGEYRVWNSASTKTTDVHATEINSVLDWICETHPSVPKLMQYEIAIARARADYHTAKYLFSINRCEQAKATMRAIRHVSARYFALYVLSCIPTFWTVIHRPAVKLWLSSRFVR